MRYPKLSARVIELRQEKEITRADLQKRSGLSSSCISNIENHGFNMPLSTFLALCRGLDVTPNDLLLEDI